MGYLIGGGIVWLWRILGTLMVGREALGLGDVHMMAAVGACLGWPHSILGFFAAAFVGVFWTILGKLMTGTLQRQMPFGPYLAIGTVLVWFCQPGVERLLGMILRTGERFILP
jgi:leader peptidase (prepilin peptidase)/N-methyltransferase